MTPNKNAKDTKLGCLLSAILVFSGVLYVLCIFVDSIPVVYHGAARVSSCRANFKNLGLALRNYHDVYGRFPPPYIADSDGKRLHSWRVLLLPFVDGKPLYDKYRFDEPWDGPNNSKLHGEVIHDYICPSAKTHQQRFTNCVAVLGETTVWANQLGTSTSDVTDKHDETLLLIEITNSDIHWMEPRDLLLDDIVLDQPQNTNSIGSKHFNDNGILLIKMAAPSHVITTDGLSHRLSDTIDRSTLRALATIDGGETLPDSWRIKD